MDTSSMPQVLPVPPVPQPTDQPTASAVANSTATQAPAVAGPVVQAVASTPPPQSALTSKGKEVGPVSSELAGFVEVAGADAFEKEPLPAEVASWMEKVSRDNSDSKPPEIVIADKTAQAPTGHYANQPVFVLPLGEVQIQQGLSKSVGDSVRWLSTWCKKMMKRLGNQAVFNS